MKYCWVFLFCCLAWKGLAQDSLWIDNIIWEQMQDSIKVLNQEVTISKGNLQQLSNTKENERLALIGIVLLMVSFLLYQKYKNRMEEKSLLKPNKVEEEKDREWVVVHASEIGKSHKEGSPPIPCQDNHSVKSLAGGWGIAISCDGAGSAKLSHKGSKFIAQAAIQVFERIIKEQEWMKNQVLPKPKEWNSIAHDAMKELLAGLNSYAQKENILLSDLACTIIVVIYSPMGILCSHIGDGRAGYKDQNGTWKAILTPHKGEEANQTIFLTSNSWLKDNFSMDGIPVPESKVITSPPQAFTLMSDGCEFHSFELGYFNDKQQQFIEQNQPSASFFNALLKTIVGMAQTGASDTIIQEKWSYFLREGHKGLKHEPDDKTLILGVLTQKETV